MQASNVSCSCSVKHREGERERVERSKNVWGVRLRQKRGKQVEGKKSGNFLRAVEKGGNGGERQPQFIRTFDFSPKTYLCICV